MAGSFLSGRSARVRRQLAAEGGGLRRRFDAQLGGQHPRAPLVLADHRGPVAGRSVQPHQQAVAGLVQRVQRQPAPGVGQRLVVAAPGEQRAGQLLQRGRQLQAQVLGGEGLPGVELGRPLEGEAGQKVVSVKAGHFGQGGQAIVAQMLGRVAVGSDARLEDAKAAHVHLQAGLGGQGHLVILEPQPALADGAPQVIEDAAQRAMGVLRVLLRPEQRCQHIAAVRSVGGSQIGEQRQRLAAMEAHRDAVALGARWAKEGDVEGGHWDTSHEHGHIIA